MRLPSLAALPLLLASTAGCAIPPLDAARMALDDAARGYNAANAAATASKGAEHAACLAPPVPAAEAPACVDGVVVRWADRSAAITDLYAALSTARAVLSFAEATAAAGRPPDVAAVARAIDAVLAAAGRVP